RRAVSRETRGFAEVPFRAQGTYIPSGGMLNRSDWLDAACDLDWEFSYVREEEVFPEVCSGAPFLPSAAWADYREPFRTTFAEYAHGQPTKEIALAAAREANGRAEAAARLPPPWLNAVKLHAATLPLAEFAAVVGNLRGARFGRHAAWRTAATFGAL